MNIMRPGKAPTHVNRGNVPDFKDMAGNFFLYKEKAAHRISAEGRGIELKPSRRYLPMAVYVEIGALLFAVVILYLMYHFIKNLPMLLLNSVSGILIMLALNHLLHFGIAINLLSIAVVAIGGVAGLVIVVLLHMLGLAF